MSEWKHNYHSHSTFSDGKKEIPEMVKAARDAGLETFGITDHSPVPVESDWNMPTERMDEYLTEIKRAQEQIKGIDFFGGIEIDYLRGAKPLSADFLDRLDFTVGSLHYLAVADGWEVIDVSPENFATLFQKEFSSDIQRMAGEYARQQCEMLELYRPDIIGHIDLLSKFNQKRHFFDESDKGWLFPLYEVLELAGELGTIVEINTGAISRGHRNVPYPAPPLMEACAKRGIRMTLNGDSHSPEGINTAYNSAIQTAVRCGIGELWHLKKGRGFVAASIR